MSQVGSAVDLPTSLGYLLKETSSALRMAMEAALKSHGMGVTQYSCMELLAQRPGSSNSDLARGAFVTRQSMNTLLQALEREGLITRAEQAVGGRVLPTELTTEGWRRLAGASAAVKAVEDRMISDLSGEDRSTLHDLLTRCGAALRAPTPPQLP
jgi:DNA-binding MarR family transcriptional regulator